VIYAGDWFGSVKAAKKLQELGFENVMSTKINHDMFLKQDILRVSLILLAFLIYLVTSCIKQR